jgi:ABC-type uncharacterized transport system permease subunit
MSAVVTIVDPEAKRRSRALGMTFIAMGLIIYVFFVRSSSPGQLATFGLNPGRQTAATPIPNVTLPVLASLYAMALVAVALGVVQLVRGFGRAQDLVLGLVAGLLVLGFLTVQRATPIALAALSGILCERSGIVNIAIEGMMLTAAMVSALVGSLAGSMWVGLLAAVLSSGALGALLAVLSIRYKVNQIISGTAINILATGGTSFISAKFLTQYQHLNNPGKFSNWPVPVLSRIPILGPVFFENNLIVYLLFGLLIVLHVMLYHTRWGLRTRAVGEHPLAADTLGIDVFRMRYINVLLGGMVAGLGGVFLVLGSVPRFDELMTSGKGFIGLAAMIFGKWDPFGAFGASLIFGFTDTFQAKMQILRVPIPSQFMRMAPYLITMIVLAGVVGRAEAPAAEGQVYEKQ